jgi:hypothetical protein
MSRKRVKKNDPVPFGIITGGSVGGFTGGKGGVCYGSKEGLRLAQDALKERLGEKVLPKILPKPIELTTKQVVSISNITVIVVKKGRIEQTKTERITLVK